MGKSALLLALIAALMALSACADRVSGTYVWQREAETITVRLNPDQTCQADTYTFYGRFGEEGTYRVDGNTLKIDWHSRTDGKLWTIEPQAIVSNQTGNRYLRQQSGVAQPDKELTVEGAQKILDAWAPEEFLPTLSILGELLHKPDVKVIPGHTVEVTSISGRTGDEHSLEATLMLRSVPILDFQAEKQIEYFTLSKREKVEAALREGKLLLFSGSGDAIFRREGGRWSLRQVNWLRPSPFSGLPTEVLEWPVSYDWNYKFQKRLLPAL